MEACTFCQGQCSIMNINHGVCYYLCNQCQAVKIIHFGPKGESKIASTIPSGHPLYMPYYRAAGMPLAIVSI